MALYNELTTGPLSSEIAQYITSGNDGAIFDILNRKDIPVNSSVNINTFAIWCASTGMRASIQDQANNVNSPLRSIALTLLDLLQGNLNPPALDLSNSINVAMVEAWVTAGLLTSVQRDELLNLSKKLISRAEQLGIVVTIENIANALRG